MGCWKEEVKKIIISRYHQGYLWLNESIASRNRSGNHSPKPINREDETYIEAIVSTTEHLSDNKFSRESRGDHPVKYSKWRISASKQRLVQLHLANKEFSS